MRSIPLTPTVVRQAVGWYRQTDGTLVLTANPDEVRPLSTPMVHPSCQLK